jgi:hypothetical protein
MKMVDVIVGHIERRQVWHVEYIIRWWKVIGRTNREVVGEDGVKMIGRTRRRR